MKTTTGLPITFPVRLVARTRTAVLIVALLGMGLTGIALSQVVTEFSTAAATNPYGITAGPDGSLWFTESSPSALRIARITTAGVVTEFQTPTTGGSPHDIAVGSDGNLWFTESNKIGQITVAGALMEFPVPSTSSTLGNIVAGPDGNLWFTETSVSTHMIARITTAGDVTEFSIPTSATSGPGGITVGPDGNLWFTYAVHTPGTFNTHTYVGSMTTAGVNAGSFSIGTNGPRGIGTIATGPDGNLWFADHILSNYHINRITAAGVITEFPLPGPNNNPARICAGPDGNVWFTETFANQIGQITPAGVLTEFPISTANSRPFGITAGPDGSLWFAESNVNKIGQISTAGVVAEFPVRAGNTTPVGIAAGPDGNLRFTESDPDANRIGDIGTDGNVYAEFPIPTAGSNPRGLTVGSDGSLWFTEADANQVGRISPAGVVTEFSIPTADSTPTGIVAGPDCNLWFTESGANRIGRITAAGAVDEFLIPTSNATPLAVAVGGDGNLWFTESDGNQVGRITTAGVITEFPVPTAGAKPVGIAAGPDGNLWFTEATANKVARITVAGLVTEFPIPTANSGAAHIAAGPDGNLWFTESDANQIGRVTTAGGVDEFSIPTAGSLPVGIAAGPDGNVWFTESNANQIGRITTVPTIPLEMLVDDLSSAGSVSNVNSVFEPGETVQVRPVWENDLTVDQTFTGTASNLSGPSGPTYTINDSSADYGTLPGGAFTACSDCYLMTVSGTRPADHWDATFTEDLSSNSISKVWTLHVGGSFADVPVSHPFYTYVETLLHNDVTGGCGGGSYCPDSSVTRAQMAVFLLKSKLGPSHVPPPATGTVFPDVPAGSFGADWIEELARYQITGGCGSGNYCPNSSVTRAQMAVFLLKSQFGSAFTPPACTGEFGDVACPSQFADWIERLALEGVTGGCGGGDYCPGNPVTRGQMAVFLVKAFGLKLYGPAAILTGPSNPYSVKVYLQGYVYVYSPSTIHIHVGDTIIWTLHGSHSTTGSDWDSGVGPVTFAHTFTEAGTFPYHCTVNHGVGHSHQPGTVIVDP